MINPNQAKQQQQLNDPHSTIVNPSTTTTNTESNNKEVIALIPSNTNQLTKATLTKSNNPQPQDPTNTKPISNINNSLSTNPQFPRQITSGHIRPNSQEKISITAKKIDYHGLNNTLDVSNPNQTSKELRNDSASKAIRKYGQQGKQTTSANNQLDNSIDEKLNPQKPLYFLNSIKSVSNQDIKSPYLQQLDMGNDFRQLRKIKNYTNLNSRLKEPTQINDSSHYQDSNNRQSRDYPPSLPNNITEVQNEKSIGDLINHSTSITGPIHSNSIGRSNNVRRNRIIKTPVRVVEMRPSSRSIMNMNDTFSNSNKVNAILGNEEEEGHVRGDTSLPLLSNKRHKRSLSYLQGDLSKDANRLDSLNESKTSMQPTLLRQFKNKLLLPQIQVAIANNNSSLDNVKSQFDITDSKQINPTTTTTVGSTQQNIKLPSINISNKINDSKDSLSIKHSSSPNIQNYYSNGDLLAMINNNLLNSNLINQPQFMDNDLNCIKVYLAFLKDGADGKNRRLYSFQVKKLNGKVIDLKKTISTEFGYEVKQQKIYRKYKELSDDTIFSSIKDYDPDTEILLLGRVGEQAHIPKSHPKEQITEVVINDIIKANCSNITKNEFLNSTLNESLIWPPYRDWTKEADELYEKIRYYVKIVEGNENTIETLEMSTLMNLEADLHRLLYEFEGTIKKIIHILVNWRIAPINLDNLYGKGGLKWVSGGIIFRECKDWLICCEHIGDGDIAYKVADNEFKGLNELRGKLQDVMIPLGGIVDYYGIRFTAQSLIEVNKQTLIYGSNTEGIQVLNQGEEEEIKIAIQVANLMNLRKHIVYDRVDKNPIELMTPIDLEIHRLKEHNKFAVLNPIRLFPPDLTENDDFHDLSWKLLRPELVKNYSDGQLHEDYRLFTWRNPVLCNECEEFIDDYEYYYYVKRNLDKAQTILKQFYCCLNCYNLKKAKDSLKVPVNKLQKKTLPENQRIYSWINVRDGQRTYIFPTQKISLNPDAFLTYPEFTEGNARDLLDKENKPDRDILRQLSINLQEQYLTNLLKDLEKLEENPRSSEDITNLMHRYGINMRYLGRIASEARYNFTREIFVREILARSIKVLVRDGLSFLKDEPNGFNEADIKKCVLHYLNQIYTVEERNSSQVIWEFLTDLIRKKFSIAIEKDAMEKINKTGLLISLSHKVNIKFSKIKNWDFQIPDPFSYDDIISISPKCKVKPDDYHCISIALRRARQKDMIGRNKKKWYVEGGPERSLATELYRQACVMTECIYAQTSSAMIIATIYKEFAEHLESRHQEKGRPEYSAWNKSANIPDDTLSIESRLYYNKAIEIFLQDDKDEGYKPEVADCYIGLACLQKHKGLVQAQPINLSLKGASIIEAGTGVGIEATESGARIDQANPTFKYLLQGIEVLETCVGIDHPDTAEAYTKLALAYKESGMLEEAFKWIKKAFCIFYKGFGSDDDITLKTYDYFKQIAIYIDTKYEQVPLDELPEYIEKCEFGEINELNKASYKS